MHSSVPMFLVRIVGKLGQLIGCEDEVWMRPGAEKEKSADDTLVFGLVDWSVRVPFNMRCEESVRYHRFPDGVAVSHADTAEKVVNERSLSEVSMTIIALDVHADETRDGAVICSIEAGEDSCLEMRAEFIVFVAEEEVVDVKAKVDPAACRCVEDEQGVGAVDRREAITGEEVLESICPGFGSDSQTIERLDQLENRAWRAAITIWRVDVEFGACWKIV